MQHYGLILANNGSNWYQRSGEREYCTSEREDERANQRARKEVMRFSGGDRRPDASRAEAGQPGPDQDADTYVSSPSGFIDRVIITFSGVRQPIVAILLLVAFFTVLSGKPLDGLLLSIVAIALAWDAGLRARDASAQELVAGQCAHPESAESVDLSQRSVWRLRARRPALRMIALGAILAVIYSLVVGSFTLYSWPATAGVVGLGAGVVIVGWGGPTRQRVIPDKFARAGITLWGVLFVAASLWELGALLGQPNFGTGSYAHPTISTLADPLLSSALGRSAALMGWLALGYFLVDR